MKIPGAGEGNRTPDLRFTKPVSGEAFLLLLYTDGITESRNESGEQLGQEGLLALVRGLSVDSPERTVAFGHALVARLKRFRGSGPQRDDETLVVLQRLTEIEQDGPVSNKLLPRLI